jgi:hypothetical protein
LGSDIVGVDELAPVAPQDQGPAFRLDTPLPDGLTKQSLRVLKGLLLGVIVFQRVVIPGVGLPLALPVVYCGFAYLISRGVLTVHHRRSALYFTTCLACLATTLAATFSGIAPSLNSLLLLLVLYLPHVFTVGRDLRRHYADMLRFFSIIMLVTSTMGVLQFVVQLLGVSYVDVVGALLPKQFVAIGYNTSYPIVYGSALFKSNGLVFLEPSFFSQFAALAVLTQTVLGERQWRILVFLLAMFTSVSGTGVVLLAVGLAVLTVRRGVWWTARILVVGAMTIGVAIATPGIGNVFRDRSKETSNSDSSGNLRFIKPYQVLWEGVAIAPPAALIGFGSGAADREGKAYFGRTGLSLANPTLQKAWFEYGLVSGTLLVAFFIYVILGGAASPTLSAAMLCQHLLLSGGLLQPQTVYAFLLLAAIFGTPSGRESAAGPGRINPGLIRAAQYGHAD